MSIKTPRLIRDRCGVFYFRLLVPKELRASVGKLEWRRSLRTKHPVLARFRALVLSTAVEELMTHRNSDDWEHLLGPDSPLRKAVTIDMERGYFHADTPEEAKSLDSILKSLTAHRAIQSKAGASPDLPSILPVSRSGTVLEVASKRFLNERKATLAPATLLKHTGALNGYIKLTGNIDVALADHETIATYKESLLKAQRSASTINDHLSILRGFFDYCIGNKIAKIANPTDKMLIKGGRNQTESYEMFEPQELAKIFNPVTYKKAMRMPDFYWGPLLALFTGARAEELASLDLDQIKVEEGVDVIHILDGKTKNARRKVPVHKTLIEMRFLDYVYVLRQLGYKKLFPHLQDGKNGFKKNMCRKFGEYLDQKDVGISSPFKVFHSFRHTVITKLTNQGVNEGLKRQMVGHEATTVVTAHDDYIHEEGLTMASFARAINTLQYQTIDFNELRVDCNYFTAVIARRIAQNEKLQSKKKKGAR